MTDEPRRGRSDDEDIDARFAEIVAGLGSSPADEPGRPEEGAAPAGPERPVDEGDARRPAPADPPVQGPATWREWNDPEVEEHFVPPDPPPLPAGDLHFWAILLGLLGGPLILFLTHGFGVLHDSVWTWLGLGLSVGGFVLLVLRLPTTRDDDPTGGARV